MADELPSNWLDHIFDIFWESDDSAASCRFVAHAGSPAGTATFTLAELCRDYPHLPQAIRVARYLYTDEADRVAALQHWRGYLQQPRDTPPLLGHPAISRDMQASWFREWATIEHVPGRPSVELWIHREYEQVDLHIKYTLLEANFPWVKSCLALCETIANSKHEAADMLKLEIIQGPQKIKPLALPEGIGLFNLG
jgi:hypothetical protein